LRSELPNCRGGVGESTTETPLPVQPTAGIFFFFSFDSFRPFSSFCPVERFFASQRFDSIHSQRKASPSRIENIVVALTKLAVAPLRHLLGIVVTFVARFFGDERFPDHIPMRLRRWQENPSVRVFN